MGRGDGTVLDGASEKLAATRAARRDNLSRLRAEIEAWARALHRQGAAERAQVTPDLALLCQGLIWRSSMGPTLAPLHEASAWSLCLRMHALLLVVRHFLSAGTGERWCWGNFRDGLENPDLEWPVLAQVVVRRERLCVAVKAGRQGDLPKGSLNLATSATGSTFYMDPATTVPLNNAEALLAEQAAAEEARILAALSAAVAARAGRIRQVSFMASRSCHALLTVQPMLALVPAPSACHAEGLLRMSAGRFPILGEAT